MAALFSPWGNQQIFDANGDPATGWKIYPYAAGSSTPLTTYTDATGSVAQSFPIILDTLGLPINGLIWLAQGSTYKFVLTNASDVVQKTVDGISGVSDSTPTLSQWQSSNVGPTYISANSFAVTGDQTTEFHVGRRLQFATSVGTVYGTIATSVYTTLTTVTMTMGGSQVLDAGLSTVNLSILRADNSALPTGTTQSPSDKSENLATTKYVDEAIPAGAILPFKRTTAPTGWLKANGASGVSRAAYPNLDTAIYCGDANNATALDCYRYTDPANPTGTRSITGPYIMIPDERGEFPRYLDDGRGVDTGRTLYSAQAAAFASHNHGVNDPGHVHGVRVDTSIGTSAFNSGALVTGVSQFGLASPTAIMSATTGITIVSTGGTETRPRNKPGLACIKY